MENDAVLNKIRSMADECDKMLLKLNTDYKELKDLCFNEPELFGLLPDIGRVYGDISYSLTIAKKKVQSTCGCVKAIRRINSKVSTKKES